MRRQDDRYSTDPEPDRMPADPVVEAYKRDLDRTLIREQLRRTADERAGNMIAALRFAEALRVAARARRAS